MTENVENHILNRYKLLKKVGSGAYGHVWKVQQIKTNKILALKKIFDAFQHSTDAQRTYRQIILLNQIDHQHIVKLHRVIKSENDKDLYLLFQFMQADLHNAIGQKILKDLHQRYIIYQLIKGIKYLHDANIIHRDLKPSNLLINSDCSLKICDLGLARTIQTKDSQEDAIFTEEVATRWYRAPEVLLGSQSYGQSADIWSIGCILAQMITGKPFFPGNSTLNQLQKIISFTGRPTRSDIQAIQSPLAQSMLQSIGKISQKKIKQFFKPQVQQQAIDLVLKTIQFNPQKRLTAQQILKHPYIVQFNKINLPSSQKKIKKIYLDISQKKKSVKQYKRLIYDWINKTYKDDLENQFTGSLITNKNNLTQARQSSKQRQPLKESMNQHPKKSFSSTGKMVSSSLIKETPTYQRKKLTQTPKLVGNTSPSATMKKLFRCNSQKSVKPIFNSTTQQFMSSPLSTTYKQFKALKQSYFNSGKNIVPKKTSFGMFKQTKPEKGYLTTSTLLNKFSKASSSQSYLPTSTSSKYYSKQGKGYV